MKANKTAGFAGSPKVLSHGHRQENEMKRTVAAIATFICIGSFAFPRASDAERSAFRQSYVKCLEECCENRAFLSGLGLGCIRGSSQAYSQLAAFGPEVIELIYQESVSGDCAQAVVDSRKFNSAEVAANSEMIIEDLWCLHTMQRSTRYTDVDFMWTGESPSFQWEGGDAIAAERAKFLVNEMSIAKRESRDVDARRAMGNLQIMGVFAFPTLFGELMRGHDDVVEILAAEAWVRGKAPTLSKDGLMKWWKSNADRYELPQQAAGFSGSAQLGKWSRIESKDRKIKVYDPIKWNHAISAISDTARLEVSDFSGFFDSVTSSGTNLSLKCVQTGIRYRCVFNEVEYGRRYTDFGETLLLPEGSSLVLTGGGRKLTFLPIASPCSPVRGFHVSLTNDFLGHGERVKNGFLLFSPSVGRDLSEKAVDSKRSEDACRLNGVVFTQSLTID